MGKRPSRWITQVRFHSTKEVSKVELPEDCDVSRALTLVLESLPQRVGDDWQVIEKTAPEKDRIAWAGLGMERIVKVGDKVSINYYKKK